MVFTKSQAEEIKDTVKTVLGDKEFMNAIATTIADMVMTRLSGVVDQLTGRVNELEVKVAQVENINKTLLSRMGQIEQFNKRKCLRVYGIKEEKNENLPQVLSDFFRSKLHLDLHAKDINSCYRIKGRDKVTDEAKPIFVEFSSLSCKNSIYVNKSKLRGTKVVVREELARSRHDLFVAASSKFGRKNTWTQGGRVFVKLNGKKAAISSMEELETL